MEAAIPGAVFWRPLPLFTCWAAKAELMHLQELQDPQTEIWGFKAV